MLKRKKRLHWFEISSMLVLAIVAFWIGACILTIIVLGMPALVRARGSKELWMALYLSLKTATLSTFICGLLAIPSAYALTQIEWPGKKIIRMLVEMPLSLPYLLLGLCLLLLFSTPMGKWLKECGFKVVFDEKGIIIAQCFVNLPFVIKLICNVFNEIDPRMIQVSKSLGADQWIRFKTIIVPLTQNAILAALLLAWSRALGEFGATLMLVGVTRMKTETLPASIYLNVSTGDNQMAMASAILLLLLSFISSAITQYYSQKQKKRVRM